jgi:hypothetical protein
LMILTIGHDQKFVTKNGELKNTGNHRICLHL